MFEREKDNRIETFTFLIEFGNSSGYNIRIKCNIPNVISFVCLFVVPNENVFIGYAGFGRARSGNNGYKCF